MPEVIHGEDWRDPNKIVGYAADAGKTQIRKKTRAQQQAEADEKYATGRMKLDDWRKVMVWLGIVDANGDKMIHE